MSFFLGAISAIVWLIEHEIMKEFADYVIILRMDDLADV